MGSRAQPGTLGRPQLVKVEYSFLNLSPNHRRTLEVGNWSPEHEIHVSHHTDTAVELGLQSGADSKGRAPFSVDPPGVSTVARAARLSHRCRF